jgi:NAD(P)H-nitrite reductase large subunit
MAGRATTYAGGTACNSLNYFGLSLVSAGLVSAPAGDGYAVLKRSEPERGLYRKIILKDRKLAGLIYVGEIERSGIAFGLLREGADVADFAERLLADDVAALRAAQGEIGGEAQWSFRKTVITPTETIK